MSTNGNGNGHDGTPALKSLFDGDETAWLNLCVSVSDANARTALIQIGAMLASMHRRNKERNQSLAELKACSVGWPDLSFETDERGRPGLKLTKGSTVIHQRLGLTYQGLWRSGIDYLRNDSVTHDRSLFIAQIDHPSGKPADASGHWRLCVMRGRDGRDGKDGRDVTAPKDGEP